MIRQFIKFKHFRYILSAAVLLLVIFAVVFFAANRWGLTPCVLIAQSLPVKDDTTVDFPEAYLIETANYFESQGTNQCGGYSAAFVMRYLGHEITGSEVYAKLGYKLSSGYVIPQAIVDYFEGQNISVTLYHSNLAQLKTHVSTGIPVIVLLGQGGSWQHYATVVGYDESNIYLYDSLKQTVENQLYYNRSMEINYFEKLWENGIPLFENTSFVVTQS